MSSQKTVRSGQTSLLERGRAEGPPSQLRRSLAHRGHNRGTPQNRDETQTSMDGSNRGRDAHIPTEIRQESEGQILAGPMGGWGVGHTTSDRFTRSRGVHSLHACSCVHACTSLLQCSGYISRTAVAAVTAETRTTGAPGVRGPLRTQAKEWQSGRPGCARARAAPPPIYSQ